MEPESLVSRLRKIADEHATEGRRSSWPEIAAEWSDDAKALREVERLPVLLDDFAKAVHGHATGELGAGDWRRKIEGEIDTLLTASQEQARDQETVTLNKYEARELFSLYLAHGMRPPEIHPQHPLVTGAEKLAAGQAEDGDTPPPIADQEQVGLTGDDRENLRGIADFFEYGAGRAARTAEEKGAYLRNLADRPSPEQTANSKSNPNQSKSWNSGEQDEVEVRLSLTADEQAALRHEFSEPYGRDMRLGIIGKLRTALEEEGR